jgi:uncharacterized protein (TIGR03086 family)
MSGPPADPRPAFFAAADQVVRLIQGLEPSDFARPTPCEDFDVRALAGHLVAVLRRITHVATGGGWAEVPQVVAGIDDGSLGDVAAADRDRLVAVWSDDKVLDRVLSLPPGVQLPGRFGALRYTQELVTHAWDLASALGRGDELDRALAEPVVAGARQFVPREGREHFPFGEVVDVPESAGPYERLVGWLGRDPSWRPPG